MVEVSSGGKRIGSRPLSGSMLSYRMLLGAVDSTVDTAEQLVGLVMSREKPTFHSKAMVWRISESAPMGEWVPKGAPIRKSAAQDRPHDWSMSSLDLQHGVEAVDVSDSMSGELFDELFVDSHSGKPRPPDHR